MRRIKTKRIALLVAAGLAAANIINLPASSLASLSAKKMLQCDK